MHSSGQNACFLSFFFHKKETPSSQRIPPGGCGLKKKSLSRALRTGRRGARGVPLILTCAKESRVPVGSCGVLSDFGGDLGEAPSKWVTWAARARSGSEGSSWWSAEDARMYDKRVRGGQAPPPSLFDCSVVKLQLRDVAGTGATPFPMPLCAATRALRRLLVLNARCSP